jgi:hypothetical protein
MRAKRRNHGRGLASGELEQKAQRALTLSSKPRERPTELALRLTSFVAVGGSFGSASIRSPSSSS